MAPKTDSETIETKAEKYFAHRFLMFSARKQLLRFLVCVKSKSRESKRGEEKRGEGQRCGVGKDR